MAERDEEIPERGLIVLIGPSGAGKSTWAAARFDPDEIVASDRLRAMVGRGEHDQDASADAFHLLDQVVAARIRRRLLTVVDTLGLDDERRASWLGLARAAGLPSLAVVFDTPAELCRSRNRRRSRPVPSAVLTSQLRRYRQLRDRIDGEGFDQVLRVMHSSEAVAQLAPVAVASEGGPRFMLQVSRFPWGSNALAERLSEIALAAEEAGFAGLTVMDHFIQIPQVGRHWEDIPESYTTISYLASLTSRLRLGVLVTGVTYRNLGLLAKIIATLDVLSGGRALCGLGAAWYEREHQAYGYGFVPARMRLDLLEDALKVLPLLWGPGSPPFAGKTIEMAETLCYPRPLQKRIPIIVGGGGERRTLRLAARYADACNLTGDVETVRRKRDVLAGHCREAGRDPATVEITHLVTLSAAESGAGTVRRQVDRLRRLHDEGVSTFFVALPELQGAAEVERIVPVMEGLTQP